MDELENSGPVTHAVNERIRVVVDACVGPDSTLIKRYQRMQTPGTNPEFLFLAQSHRSIPDIKILEHVLKKHDVLLTNDHALHNQARRLGFRSYTLNDRGDISGKIIANIPALKLPPGRHIKSDEELKDDYAHPANSLASALKDGMTERDFKRYRTRRRRIRGYFGDESEIAQASLTIGSLRSKQELLCGCFLALAGNSGVKGLRASEGYSISSLREAHPAWCLIHAIREIYLLQLEKKRIEIYIIPPDSLALGERLLAKGDGVIPSPLDPRALGLSGERLCSVNGGIAGLEPLGVLRTLLKGLASARVFPCVKGFFHEAMEQKLKQLSRTNSNELVRVNFMRMCQRVDAWKAIFANGDDVTI